jgi:hypothetical protein
MEDIEVLLSKVYKEGLNIYALKNKFQKEMTYEMPEHILRIVCEEYLKYRPKIKNPWAWMAKVLQLKRDMAYVQVQREKEKSHKKVNTTLLKEIFAKL